MRGDGALPWGADAVPTAPWSGTAAVGLLLAEALGLGLVLLGAVQASDATAMQPALTWLGIAVAGLIVGGAAGGAWIAGTREAVHDRRTRLGAAIDRCVADLGGPMPAGASGTGDALAGPASVEVPGASAPAGVAAGRRRAQVSGRAAGLGDPAAAGAGAGGGASAPAGVPGVAAGRRRAWVSAGVSGRAAGLAGPASGGAPGTGTGLAGPASTEVPGAGPGASAPAGVAAGRRRAWVSAGVSGTGATLGGPVSAGVFLHAPGTARFHRADCPFVRHRTVVESTAADLLAEGLERCEVCLPDG